MNIKLLAYLKYTKEISVYIKEIKTIVGKPYSFFHLSIMGHQRDRALYFRLLLEVKDNNIEVFDSDGMIVLDDRSDSYKIPSEENRNLARSYFLPILTNSGLMRDLKEELAKEGEAYTISTGTAPEIIKVIKPES